MLHAGVVPAAEDEEDAAISSPACDDDREERKRPETLSHSLVGDEMGSCWSNVDAHLEREVALALREAKEAGEQDIPLAAVVSGTRDFPKDDADGLITDPDVAAAVTARRIARKKHRAEAVTKSRLAVKEALREFTIEDRGSVRTGYGDSLYARLVEEELKAKGLLDVRLDTPGGRARFTFPA